MALFCQVTDDGRFVKRFSEGKELAKGCAEAKKPGILCTGRARIWQKANGRLETRASQDCLNPKSLLQGVVGVGRSSRRVRTDHAGLVHKEVARARRRGQRIGV